MRKFLNFSIGSRALSASILLLCTPVSSLAAEDVKTVEIVRNAEGRFVFAEPKVALKAGQSIKWVANDANVPHQLVPDTDKDAFKDTGEFESPVMPTQKFDAVGVINYHCTIHPRTMKGTITVSSGS